jgi:hypothetical protein
MDKDESTDNCGISAYPSAGLGMKKYIFAGAKNFGFKYEPADEHKGHAGEYADAEDICAQAVKIADKAMTEKRKVGDKSF